MKVKIVNKSSFDTPFYATERSAGMDIKANIDEPITLQPLQRAMVPTGLYIALPEGTEAQIRPRSGLAIKKGITVLNSPGTIDADYRGEIMVALHNHNSETVSIEPKERIAQLYAVILQTAICLTTNATISILISQIKARIDTLPKLNKIHLSATNILISKMSKKSA